jgi:glycosyltransferase involved in cell wall biosynthesis
MRILFLTPRLPHAQSLSGNQVVYQRMRHLIAKGHEVGLCSFAAPAERKHADRLCDGLIETTLVPLPRFRNASGPANPGGEFRHYRAGAMMKQVGASVAARNYAVVIAEFTTMGQYLVRNPSLPAVRRIVSCHESSTLHFRRLLKVLGVTPAALKAANDYGRYRRVEFRIYRAADAVLALTPEDRNGLLAEKDSLTTHVIPSGVDVQAFRPRPDLPKEDVIVFTGRYTGEQNRDAFRWFTQEVWQILSERMPQLRVTFVGRDPTPEMYHLSTRDPRIEIRPNVDDVRPYLARAKVFINPVRTGSGLRGKLLEAMAMGLPVVTTSIGAEGVPIFQGENGFLADTPAIMARTLELLLQDDPLRTAVGNSARALAESRFSWDYSTSLLENVLKDVVSRREFGAG